MGLSGNRVKQRIPDDPRNTRWATDTSAPGFRLLSSMGWTPADSALGNAESQALIAAHSPGFSKKIAAIPIAKDSNAGIGARKPGQAVGIGGLRAMGLPVGAMGFVTANAGVEGELPVKEIKAGGEFGRLLERLNAASTAASSSADESDEPTPKEKRKKDKKKRKLEEVEAEETILVPDSTTPTPTDSGASTPTILKNPRMAARSKHLRAKRMASSSNAAAMAEILGIAPSPLPTSVTSTPSSPKPLLPVTPPSADGWPQPPPRSVLPSFAPATSGALASIFAPSSSGALAATFAPSSTGALAPTFTSGSTLASTFVTNTSGSLASTFTSSSTGVLASTFTVETATTTDFEVIEVVESEKAREKREKRERKAAKEAKKKAKAALETVTEMEGESEPKAEEEEAVKLKEKKKKRPVSNDEDGNEEERKRARKLRKEEKRKAKARSP